MPSLVGGTVVWNFTAETKNFDTALSRTSTKARQFGTDMEGTGKKADKSISSIAKGAAALGGLAVVFNQVKTFAVDAVSAFAQFESNLGLLQSVTSATNTQLSQMKQLSVDLGNDLTLPGISAADAASAMIELGKAGLGVNDVLGAAKGVLQGAKAGNIEFSESATLVATALNTFRLKGNQATKVADLFAAAANASSAEVEDVGFALQMSAAQAAQLNIPLDATVGLIAQLANQGIRGSDAGTSLKTMLQRLVPQTKKAKTAFKDLGLDVFDAKGNFIGIRPTIQQLSNALSKLTQEQRQSTLYTIFGSDAIRAASIITKDGVKGFDDMREAVNRQGAAADLAASRNRGIKGSLDALKSSFETIQLTVGEFLSKALNPVVKVLSGNLKEVLIGVSVGILAIGVAAGIAAAPMLAVLAPILGLSVAAGATAGAIVYLQKEFQLFTPVVQTLGTYLKDFVSAVNNIAAQLKTEFAPAISFASRNSETFKKVAQVLMVFLAGPLTVTFRVVIGTLRLVGGAIAYVIDTIKVIKQVLPAAVKAIGEAIKTIPKAIIDYFKDSATWLVESGKNIVSGLINGLKSGLQSVKDTVGEIGESVKNRFKSLLGIQSPSKVFEGFGKNITQGLIAGINQSHVMVDAAVSGLSQSTMAPASTALDRPVANTSNNNVTVQLNMSGVMTRSRSELRDVAKDMLKAVDEELTSKNLAPILPRSV